jgi:hypothetical protein
MNCPDSVFFSLCKGHISEIKISISLFCTRDIWKVTFSEPIKKHALKGTNIAIIINMYIHGNSQVLPEFLNSTAQQPRYIQQKGIYIGREPIHVLTSNRCCGILAGFTARWQS